MQKKTPNAYLALGYSVVSDKGYDSQDEAHEAKKDFEKNSPWRFFVVSQLSDGKWYVLQKPGY